MVIPPIATSISGLNSSYLNTANPFTITGNTPIVGSIFTSTLPSGLTDNGDGTAIIDLTGVPAGIYEITYSVTSATTNCTSMVTVSFEVLDSPGVIFTGMDTTYCQSDNLLLSLTGFPTDSNGVFSTTGAGLTDNGNCLLYTSPSPRDATLSRMPSSA